MPSDFSLIDGVLCRRVDTDGWHQLTPRELTGLVVRAHADAERLDGLRGEAEARSESLTKTLLSHAQACEAVACQAHPRVSRRLKDLADRMRKPQRQGEGKWKAGRAA